MAPRAVCVLAKAGNIPIRPQQSLLQLLEGPLMGPHELHEPHFSYEIVSFLEEKSQETQKLLRC